VTRPAVRRMLSAGLAAALLAGVPGEQSGATPSAHARAAPPPPRAPRDHGAIDARAEAVRAAAQALDDLSATGADLALLYGLASPRLRAVAAPLLARAEAALDRVPDAGLDDDPAPVLLRGRVELLRAALSADPVERSAALERAARRLHDADLPSTAGESLRRVTLARALTLPPDASRGAARRDSPAAAELLQSVLDLPGGPDPALHVPPRTRAEAMAGLIHVAPSDRIASDLRAAFLRDEAVPAALTRLPLAEALARRRLEELPADRPVDPASAAHALDPLVALLEVRGLELAATDANARVLEALAVAAERLRPREHLPRAARAALAHAATADEPRLPMWASLLPAPGQRHDWAALAAVKALLTASQADPHDRAGEDRAVAALLALARDAVPEELRREAVIAAMALRTRPESLADPAGVLATARAVRAEDLRPLLDDAQWRGAQARGVRLLEALRSTAPHLARPRPANDDPGVGFALLADLLSLVGLPTTPQRDEQYLALVERALAAGLPPAPAPVDRAHLTALADEAASGVAQLRPPAAPALPWRVRRLVPELLHRAGHHAEAVAACTRLLSEPGAGVPHGAEWGVRLLRARALAAGGDRPAAFEELRRVAEALEPTRAGAGRTTPPPADYWEAWADMLEMLLADNADGQRSAQVRLRIRALRTLDPALGGGEAARRIAAVEAAVAEPAPPAGSAP
jgi:hypothetical protein